MIMDNFTLLNKTLEPFSVEVSEKQFEQFELYRDLLKEWNTRMNLTAITDDEEIIVKHFADSLTIVPYIEKYGPKCIADVGTGAGFPGIPIKIMFPEIEVILIDSLEKRLNFLQEVIAQLGLKGISTVHSRAEDIGRNSKYRDRIDFVTARAVAAMPVLLEYCMPLVKVGGYFVPMKGYKDDGNYSNALKLLSGKQLEKNSFLLKIDDISDEQASRNIYVFQKTAPTKGTYPRKAGTPSKQPL